MLSRRKIGLGIAAACIALCGVVWALFSSRARWRKEKNHSHSLRQQETLILRELAEAAFRYFDSEARGLFPTSPQLLMKGVSAESARAIGVLEAKSGTPKYWTSPSGEECGIAYAAEDGEFDIESLEMMRNVAKGKKPGFVLRVVHDKWAKRLFNKTDVFVYMKANRICYLNSVFDFSGEWVGGGIQMLRCEAWGGFAVEHSQASAPP